MRVTGLFARNMTKLWSVLLEKRTENTSIELTAPVTKRKLQIICFAILANIAWNSLKTGVQWFLLWPSLFDSVPQYCETLLIFSGSGRRKWLTVQDS